MKLSVLRSPKFTDWRKVARHSEARPRSALFNPERFQIGRAWRWASLPTTRRR